MAIDRRLVDRPEVMKVVPSSAGSSRGPSPPLAAVVIHPDSDPDLIPPERKFLELKSPVGAPSMKYAWPLKKGKGSLRRSEVSGIVVSNRPNPSYQSRFFLFLQDKQDEAAEIVDTIR